VLSYPEHRGFRPQPEGGEGFFALAASGFASPPKGTGRVLAHGIAIGRLMYIQYTAPSAVSPCAKIAAVAHAELGQSFPMTSPSGV
jgi:hypothetical protein